MEDELRWSASHGALITLGHEAERRAFVRMIYTAEHQRRRGRDERKWRELLAAAGELVKTANDDG